MRTSFLLGLLLLSTPVLRANPEIATVVGQEYGAATSEGIVLLMSAPVPAEPDQWFVYARDPFRPGELVRSLLTLTNNSWAPKADGAGDDILTRVPPQPIPFNRVKFRTADVRRIAQDNAVLAKTSFINVQYQLAANATSSAPEWGLSLLDTVGVEVGFIVISAETGAVLHQQWGTATVSGNDDSPRRPPATRAEEAADEVKRNAREAWQWSGESGREVGRFFKRLFRN